MSLYNMVFGVNPFAGVLLTALRLSARDVPRIRDVYLNFDDAQPRRRKATFSPARDGAPKRMHPTGESGFPTMLPILGK